MAAKKKRKKDAKIRRSFSVDVEKARLFKTACADMGITMEVGINEAMEDWTRRSHGMLTVSHEEYVAISRAEEACAILSDYIDRNRVWRAALSDILGEETVEAVREWSPTLTFAMRVKGRKSARKP